MSTFILPESLNRGMATVSIYGGVGAPPRAMSQTVLNLPSTTQGRRPGSPRTPQCGPENGYSHFIYITLRMVYQIIRFHAINTTTFTFDAIFYQENTSTIFHRENITII